TESARRIATSKALTRPADVPTTTDRTMRPRTSSTTAAPRMGWATGSVTKLNSRMTAAVMATLVAVNVAPTNKAIVNRVPLTPIDVVGARYDAVPKPTTSGRTTPPKATAIFLGVYTARKSKSDPIRKRRDIEPRTASVATTAGSKTSR